MWNRDSGIYIRNTSNLDSNQFVHQYNYSIDPKDVREFSFELICMSQKLDTINIHKYTLTFKISLVYGINSACLESSHFHIIAGNCCIALVNFLTC